MIATLDFELSPYLVFEIKCFWGKVVSLFLQEENG